MAYSFYTKKERRRLGITVLFNAEKLQSERKQRDLTQATLAERADTSERYIRSLETCSKVNPSAVLVFLLSRALHITMEDLMMVKQEDS